MQPNAEGETRKPDSPWRAESLRLYLYCADEVIFLNPFLKGAPQTDSQELAKWATTTGRGPISSAGRLPGEAQDPYGHLDIAQKSLRRTVSQPETQPAQTRQS